MNYMSRYFPLKGRGGALFSSQDEAAEAAAAAEAAQSDPTQAPTIANDDDLKRAALLNPF